MFQPDPSYRSPAGSPHYYPVSIRKLILLSIASFGVYQILWLYRNWWAVRLRTGQRLSPIWRTLLFWVFGFILFRRIRESADQQGVITGFSPVLAGVSYAFLALFWRLDAAFWFTSVLTVLPLIAAQQLVNRVNQVVAPECPLDHTLSAWQCVTVPLGGLGFMVAVLGTAAVAF